MEIAIRQSQKINSRIHNSRIAIRQRIAQLGCNGSAVKFLNLQSRIIIYSLRVRVRYFVEFILKTQVGRVITSNHRVDVKSENELDQLKG